MHITKRLIRPILFFPFLIIIRLAHFRRKELEKMFIIINRFGFMP